MRENKDTEWNTHKNGEATYPSATLDVLMDIRDELKQLNRTVNNSWFCRVKSAVERIDKRLQKKIKLNKGRG